MSDQHAPSEASIEKLLSKHTPRQLAIGYLRASRRARQAETAFNVMDKIASATDSAAKWDTDAVIKDVEAATRILKRAKQHHE